MIYFICYELNKKDKETLLKSVPNEAHRQMLENLDLIDPSDGKKLKRRRDEMTTDQFNEYLKRF
jgi:hypothetical protein